jgi:quercetin dioxygenase-like cupin family protein
MDLSDATSIDAYGSVGAASIRVADGDGEAHVYVISFEPGGRIGPHVAGFGQLFVPTAGSGWVAGADGVRVPVSPGEAGFIERGETHSKGSEVGMTALMIQVSDLTPHDLRSDRG